jgi:hypothetical protein
MKTSSKALIGLGIFLFIVAAALFLLFSDLDRIVAAAIEKYGSEATGTKVGVSSVRLDLKGGKGSIRNLSVGNPPGFSEGDAFRLEDISIAVNTGSLTGNPVVIDQVTILSPRIAYEINKDGQSNIELIKKKLQGVPAKETGGKSSADKEGKKVVIRSLVIDKGEIAIRVAALSGKPLSAALPRLELKNLGGKGGGSPGDIARQVLGPLANQVAVAASGAGVGQYLGKGADDLKRALEEAARGKQAVPGKESAKELGDGLKKIFGK